MKKDSIAIVAFSALALIIGLCIGLPLGHLATLNSRCDAKELAKKALNYNVIRPSTIKISSISEPDSVINKQIMTENEQLEVATLLMKANSAAMKLMDDSYSLDIDDSKALDIMAQQAKSTSLLCALMQPADIQPKDTKKLTGWKVKIDFEAETVNGNSYRAEAWCILNPEMDCVLEYFEIPII